MDVLDLASRSGAAPRSDCDARGCRISILPALEARQRAGFGLPAPDGAKPRRAVLPVIRTGHFAHAAGRARPGAAPLTATSPPLMVN
jgi:hypothetical protein